MDGYEQRIGRYSAPLAEQLARVAPLRAGDRVLDVGCGSGALTRRLADIAGAACVAAVDTSAADARACASRVPGADVRVAPAEALPFADDAFDAVFAQLLVHLVPDAPACAAEMRRVAVPGAPVVTCVWDFADGMTLLRAFWDAARRTGAPGVASHDQANLRFATLPALRSLWLEAGLRDVEGGALTATVRYAGFDQLWRPLTVPDGAPGRFLATLDAEAVAAVGRALHRDLGGPEGAFSLSARAWYVVGRA